MRYVLQPRLLSPPPPLDISADRYRAIKEARNTLTAAFELEENFDLLVGNYLELEQSALNVATESLARRRHDYADLFDIRADVNRRAVNFLSTARLFVDQLPQKVEGCQCEYASIKQQLAESYGASFEYRFMDALRNHVQHSGTAVHRFSLGSRWLPPGKREKDELSFGVFAERHLLAQDRSFKKSTLRECPDRVDLLLSTRKYLESLGAAQTTARKLVAAKVLEARRITEEAIAEYEQFSSASALGLAAFLYPRADESSDVPVFLDWDEVRKKLEARNGSLVNLSLRYVTSRAHDA
jgi:hypothetical protein